MPIKLNNDRRDLSFQELIDLRERGYSVVKSPHVGNQHPINLLCALAGISLHLVTFTKGELDRNFHPHLIIEGGKQYQLCKSSIWTPFARAHTLESVREIHEKSMRAAFPALEIHHDDWVLTQDMVLGEQVLEAATEAVSRLWYRKVSHHGEVTKLTEIEQIKLGWNDIKDSVFSFNSASGYIVPNIAHILMDFVYQTLSSGKSEVYHLSGPQMVGYIGKAIKRVSKAYDALRMVRTDLPEELVVNIVPVAQCRFLTHIKRRQLIDEFDGLLKRYESSESEVRSKVAREISEFAAVHAEFTESIELGRFLSQYDLNSADDLVVSEWMRSAPLGRVASIFKRMEKATQLVHQ